MALVDLLGPVNLEDLRDLVFLEHLVGQGYL